MAQTRIVIFDRTPLRGDLAAARRSNTCAGAEGSGGLAAGRASGSATAGKPNAGGLRPERRTGQAATGSDDRAVGRPFSAGVLGARFDRAADAVKNVPPVVFVLLGFAIALLTIAALPLRYVPNARVAAMLAYRRRMVAIAGATALASVMFLYAFV